MSTFDEILARAKERIDEIDVHRASDVLDQDRGPALIDVREKNEWDEGHIPGAKHVPRGYLELRIENAVPNKSTPVLLYCAGGVRSALA
ncbi:MAG: molybdopterin biosynthesis protein MoeB, partial [Chloroflexi bacterium]|nr:molybdopterin biosynthesis protein MoeB [Chloroflexota bacterium]